MVTNVTLKKLMSDLLSERVSLRAEFDERDETEYKYLVDEDKVEKHSNYDFVNITNVYECAGIGGNEELATKIYIY